MEGGYTSVFELICPGCGDHPYLDFREVPPQLQQLRGPHSLQAGLAAYEEHLGLLSRPEENSAAGSGSRDAENDATRVPEVKPPADTPPPDTVPVIAAL